MSPQPHDRCFALIVAFCIRSFAAPVLPEAARINMPFGLPPLLLDRPLIKVNGPEPAREGPVGERSLDISRSGGTTSKKPVAEVNLPFYKMRMPFSEKKRTQKLPAHAEAAKMTGTGITGNLDRSLDSVGPPSELLFPNKLKLPLSVMQMPFNFFEMPLSRILLPLSYVGQTDGTLTSVLSRGGIASEGNLQMLRTNSEVGTGEKSITDGEKSIIDADATFRNADTGGIPPYMGASPFFGTNSQPPDTGVSGFVGRKQSVEFQGSNRMTEFSQPYSFLNLPLSYMNFPFSYLNLPFQGLHLPFLNLNTPMSMVTSPFAELMYNFPPIRSEEPTLFDRLAAPEKNETKGVNMTKSVENLKRMFLPNSTGKPRTREEKFMALKTILNKAITDNQGSTPLKKPNMNSVKQVFKKILEPTLRSIPAVEDTVLGAFATPFSMIETPLSLLMLPLGFVDNPLSYINLPLSHFALPFSYMVTPFSSPLTSLNDIRVLTPDPTEPETNIYDLPPSLLETLNPDDPFHSYLNLPLSEMNMPFAVTDMPFQILSLPLAHLNLPAYQIQQPFTHLHMPFEYSGFPFSVLPR